MNIDRNVDGPCEQAVASGFTEYSIADAVELGIDRVKTTKVVQQRSSERIP